MAKVVKFSFSGVGKEDYHDGAMKVEYAYVLPTIPTDPIGKQDYGYFLGSSSNSQQVSSAIMNFTTQNSYNITSLDGALTNNVESREFSIYRREYERFEKYIKQNGTYQVQYSTYVGNWEPVALLTTEPFIRDFNITSGRSYQYSLFPYTGTAEQLFANVDDEHPQGAPVKTFWDEWSLAELIPVETSVDAPIVKKAYKVDLDNIWLFKYSLQTGEQTQNFQKQDIQTLGQYNRYGYGQQNFVSGNVSCLLGSEIIPYSKYGYVERRMQSINAPLSTNEKVAMLRQWRKIAFSPNPKLLKDIKGQSWIVQIVSNSNNPQNFYPQQPDTISFSWKEISSLDKVTIIGDGYDLADPGTCGSNWEPEGTFKE